MTFDEIFSKNDAETVSTIQDDIERLKAGEGQFLKTLNVARSGTIQLAYAGFNTGTDVAIVTHSLGYTPTFLCFFVNGGTYQPLPYWDFGFSGSTLQSALTVLSDENQLQFDWSHRVSQPPNTLTIKYYIFEEPASV